MTRVPSEGREYAHLGVRGPGVRGRDHENVQIGEVSSDLPGHRETRVIAALGSEE